MARREAGSSKGKLVRAAADLTTVPEPATTADRIVLEIRKFIAAAIFFNGQVADAVGLGLTDMQMIHALQLYGPATPSRLAASTGLSSGGVTVALDRLEKSGYIRRDPNPADRRSLLVTIVPAKLRKLGGLYEDVERETLRLLGELTECDLEAVVRFFETLSRQRTAINLKRLGAKALKEAPRGSGPL
jgi:DNA-binding MarR family transcriptional regulator